MSQENIILEVDPSDTIASLKKEIKDRKGFPADEQRLVFHGRKLEDDQTVSDYNIQNNSTLSVVLPVPGKHYPMEVTLLTEAGRLSTLRVKPIDSISEVKQKIQNMTGVPPHKQSLTFAGKELEDACTISDYNIRNKSAINFVKKIEVYVVTQQCTQERMTLQLRPMDTVRSVKDEIRVETNISPCRQVLELGGIQLDYDFLPLNYANIKNESTLFLNVAVRIFVRMSTGSEVMLNLFTSNTIMNVKKIIQFSEDIPCDLQYLFFHDEHLMDSHTLSDYNIQNESVLRCNVKIRISIKIAPDVDAVSVDAYLDDKVKSVRDRIQGRVSIPLNQLYLVYNGEKLNNRYTLRHYKLRNGAVLNVDQSGVRNLDLRIDGEAQRPREASSNQPSTQEVLNRIADKCFENVDPSNPEELNGFVTYLEKVRKALVLDAKSGSLIFTLECGSLQILDDLWKDYGRGHLDRVAQEYLVTKDILKEFGLSSFQLKSNIKEDDYNVCRQQLATNEANQMLERLREELLGTFLHWIPIRRDTKRKLEELARNLPNLQGNTGLAIAATVGSVVGAVGAAIAAPFTFGTSLVAAGASAAMAAGASYLSSDKEKKLRLAEVQVAINKDRRACADIQRQLDSLRRTFTSSSAISTLAGTTVGTMVRSAVSDAFTRASRYADSSDLPRDITQLVKSSLDRHEGSTSPIVGEIRSILDYLKCPGEAEIKGLVPKSLAD